MKWFRVCLFVVIMFMFFLHTSPKGEEDITTNPAMSLLPGKGLDGWIEKWFSPAWSRRDDSLIGHLTVDRNAQIRTGDTTWSDYEISVTGALIEGSNLQVLFRISDDGASYYAFDWGVVGKVALSRFGPDGPRVILSFVDYPIKRGREYDIVVIAREQSLKTFIDGNLVHDLSDSTYSTGGVGFNMWHKARVLLKDPKIKHLK